MMAKRPNLWVKGALIIILYGIAWGYLITSIDTLPFHPDESLWVWRARYFKTFLLERNFTDSLWKSSDAFDNPPVGKYFFGLALYLAGKGNEKTNDPLVFERGYEWNKAEGNIPLPSHLKVCRLMMTVFGAASCVLLYLLADATCGSLAGMLAYFLMLNHVLTRDSFAVALSEPVLTFFLLGSVLFLVLFFRSWQEKRQGRMILFSSLAGTAGGLATGVKLTGFSLSLIGACVYGLMFIFSFRRLSSASVLKNTANRGRLATTVALCALVFLACFGLAFYLPNPTLYGHPVANVAEMVRIRLADIFNQQVTYGVGLESYVDRLQFVLKSIFGLYRMDGYIFSHFCWLPLDLLFFIIGLAVLSYQEIYDFFKKGIPSVRLVMLAWVYLTFISMVAWIPLAWPRYLYPLVPAVQPIIAWPMARILIVLKEWSLQSMGFSKQSAGGSRGGA